MQVYFWVLYFVPLIYVSVFVPVLYYFDHYSFVVQFETRECDASSLVLSQEHFGYLGFSMIAYKFQGCSFSFKNAIGTLTEIALNLQITLDSMDILTILIPPVQEHGICFHLFVLSFISFINVLQFQCTSLSPPYLNLFL